MTEIPKSFQLLEGFFLPDAFWPAFGYDTEEAPRFVSIYWTPHGDESEVDDGRFAGTMDPWAYLTLVNHKKNKHLTSAYNFGDSDTEAEHRLLIDLEAGNVYAGDDLEVAGFVLDQWGKPGDHGTVITLTEEQWEALTESVSAAFSEIPPITEETLVQRMNTQRQRQAELKRVMDNA